ncbi:uncharacterized protein F5147DRAFT_657753 [Suillus discolor]|uniref:Uncharacterized protein n=1 Tax=Suillus discolor TaxID=1912936 RepID=A0A9P7JNF5_9AGAM|nr:uncharacterized protein F5147DRAFT_657753 [Suillus discolor]KAG2092133.1 hypothetical protein F5147DRAFT_657753 [Suillus discolor]
MQQSLALKNCSGNLSLWIEIDVRIDNTQRGEASASTPIVFVQSPFTACSNNSPMWYRSSCVENAPLQLDKKPTPASDAVEDITSSITNLQARLDVVEKSCNHYFELYKKYRLRWLEEIHRTEILEKYAPPNVDCYSPAQIQWDAPSPHILDEGEETPHLHNNLQ